MEAIELRKAPRSSAPSGSPATSTCRPPRLGPRSGPTPTAPPPITRFGLNLIRLYAVLSRPFLPDAPTRSAALGLDSADWPADFAAALKALPAGHAFTVPDCSSPRSTTRARTELAARFAGRPRCVVSRAGVRAADLRATDVPDPCPQPSLSHTLVTYALIALNVVVFLGFLPMLGDEARSRPSSTAGR